MPLTLDGPNPGIQALRTTIERPLAPILDATVGNAGLPDPSDEFSRYVQDFNKSTYDPSYISTRHAREIADFQPHEQTVKQTLKDSFLTTNSGVNLYEYVDRKFSHKADPNFMLKDHINTLTEGVPMQYWHKFQDCDSMAEAEDLRGDILEHMAAENRLSYLGIHALGAGLVAGIVDVDSAAALLVPAKLIRAGKAALSLKGAGQGALVGLASGAVTEPLRAEFGATGDWSDVPAGILMAGAFGTALGGAGSLLAKAPVPGGLTIKNVGDDIGDAANKAMRDTAHGMMDVGDDPLHMPERTNRFIGQDLFAGKGETLGERTKAFADTLNTKREFSNDTILGRAANRFKRAWENSAVGIDSDRLLHSESPTAKALAYTLFESPDGIYRNNESAAMIKTLLDNRGWKDFAEEVDSATRDFGKANGYSFSDRVLRSTVERDFQAKVMHTVNEINMGRDVSDGDPHVMRGVEALRKYGEFMRKEAMGPSVEHAVPGFEAMPDTGKVYMPQRWKPEHVRETARKLGNGSVKAGKDALAERVAKAYMTTNEGMTPESALVIARAVVNRMIKKGVGIDANLQGMLHGEGRLLLQDALTANGMPKAEVDDFLNKLTGVKEDKGKVGHARQRTPIDTALVIDGVRMSDLMDDDLMRSMARYHDAMSGRIAMARHGIKSRDQIENIKNTILQEIHDHGKNPTGVDRKFLDYMFSHFEEGPLGGGIDPWARRAKAVANLGLLNKLGLTQLAETGPMIAAAGWQNFVASHPMLAKMFAGDRAMGAKVSEELGWMAGNLGYEKGMLRHGIMEDMRANAHGGAVHAFGQWLDAVTAKGQRWQGMATLYYKIVDEQTNIAQMSITNRLFRDLRDGKNVSMRTKDMGLSSAQVEQMRKYVQDGVIEFNQYGHVDRLNADKWTPEMRDAYGAASTRFAYQFVQRTLAGEGLHAGHTTLGSLLLHLQTFALTAVKKQAFRNALNGDMIGTTTYGLATAGLACGVKAFLDGRYEQLTPAQVMKSAFAMSNNTGWLTYGSDPLFRMLGVDSLVTSGYGKYNAGVRLPALDTVYKMAGIPAAAVAPSKSAKDIQALKVTPLIGNFAGMARVWNSMKE